MNNEMNKAHTYGDCFLCEEYDKHIERRAWLKKNKTKLFMSGFAVSVLLAAVLFFIYMM